MEKMKAYFARCLDCDWQGDVDKCRKDYEFSDLDLKTLEYKSCPECNGAVEFINRQSLEKYLKSEEYNVNEGLEEYFKDQYWKAMKELGENHKPGL